MASDAINEEKKLGSALKNDQDQIIIEGDLARKVIKIKAVGAIAWAVVIGALGLAVVAILAAPASGGTSAIVGLAPVGIATTVLGAGTATSAVLIAVAAGGVGALNKLRKYKIVERSENRIMLKRK